MAYSRPLGAEDGTVLMACSICGNSFRFPGELRYCSDRLFRCNMFCTETENREDYDRKQAAARAALKDEVTPPFPVGVKPGWFDT